MDDDDFAAYRNTTPTRPAWATALVIALLLVLGGVLTLIVGISPLTGLMFGAAGVTALIAGILALVGVSRRP